MRGHSAAQCSAHSCRLLTHVGDTQHAPSAHAHTLPDARSASMPTSPPLTHSQNPQPLTHSQNPHLGTSPCRLWRRVAERQGVDARVPPVVRPRRPPARMGGRRAAVAARRRVCHWPPDAMRAGAPDTRPRASSDRRALRGGHSPWQRRQEEKGLARAQGARWDGVSLRLPTPVERVALVCSETTTSQLPPTAPSNNYLLQQLYQTPNSLQQLPLNILLILYSSNLFQKQVRHPPPTPPCRHLPPTPPSDTLNPNLPNNHQPQGAPAASASAASSCWMLDDDDDDGGFVGGFGAPGGGGDGVDINGPCVEEIVLLQVGGGCHTLAALVTCCGMDRCCGMVRSCGMRKCCGMQCQCASSLAKGGSKGQASAPITHAQTLSFKPSPSCKPGKGPRR
jgi:hypothetical protein